MQRGCSYFPLVVKWNEFLHWFITIWAFFKEMDKYSLNRHEIVLLQLYSIHTVMLEGFRLNIIWNSLKHTRMLFFGNKIINIGDNHMKAAEFKGLSWLKNALGMCVHEKHYQVLPTQMVPISALAHGLNMISLKYAPCGLFHSHSALIDVMAWRKTGHKP